MRVCPYCVGSKGIKGTDIVEGGEKDMGDDAVFAKHLEDEHHIRVKRPNETDKECDVRFYREHPDARSPETCKCPKCKARRGDPRDAIVSLIRTGKF